jgi:hypothetical protein
MSGLSLNDVRTSLLQPSALSFAIADCLSVATIVVSKEWEGGEKGNEVRDITPSP